MTEKQCPKPVRYKRYWPGTAPDLVCNECAKTWQAISDAMGFHTPLEPIKSNKQCCCRYQVDANEVPL